MHNVILMKQDSQHLLQLQVTFAYGYPGARLLAYCPVLIILRLAVPLLSQQFYAAPVHIRMLSWWFIFSCMGAISTT